VSEQIYIGTCGWSYDHWKDDFYKGIAKKNWLQFYAEKFSTVEINSTFYRLQHRKTFRHWHEETPENFRFSIKANRYLTHNKKLNNPIPSIELECEHAHALRSKLAAVVWQLPSNFHKDSKKLHEFTQALQYWPDTRHVIEFRNASWFDQDISQCLYDSNVAVCISDARDWPMWDIVTTDLVYVRLHGHTKTYTSAYSKSSLLSWAKRIDNWLDEGRKVHIYFDNDAVGAAPHDALRLITLLKKEKHTKQSNK
jgi:uncharacterized protein YecE (DUF72 family)